MTHFGIICPDATGHLNPMTALGHELQKRGHQITMFARLDSQARALSEGFNFCSIGASEFPLGSSTQILRRIGELGGIAGLRYNLQMVKLDVEVRLREAPNAIRSVGVEALLVDQFSPGGGSIAEFLKIPWVDICNGLPLNREIGLPPTFTHWFYTPASWSYIRNQCGYLLADYLAKSVRQVITNYRKQWKLPIHSHPNDYYSTWAQLSQLPPELDFPRARLPQCFHYNGPYRELCSQKQISFPFEKLTGQPLIYASLGSFLGFKVEVFQTIAKACADLDVQLVITTGDESCLREMSELSGSPIVVAYAPQIELLKLATLTITHAGLNTVLDCLSTGVPMVAIPITIDHPGTASRIARAGVAEVIPVGNLEVSRLRGAIQGVLANPSYKKNAARLQAAIHQTGGIRHAADIIEQVIATGKPVFSPANHYNSVNKNR